MQSEGRKRAQETIGLSFSMIFGIILIIATVTIAFFVINYFLGLNKCAQLGLFYTDLKESTNNAWNSDHSEITFEGQIPSLGLFKTKIGNVCFGNLTIAAQTSNDLQKQNELKTKFRVPWGNNVFLYPPNNACDNLASNSIPHVYVDRFFCANVTNGKVYVKIKKDSPGSPVMLIS